jgi:hypothetical protein
MQLDAIVILQDTNYAKTLATIKFDQHGQTIPNLPTVITVPEWRAGFEHCWTQGLERVLFVRSGTVFTEFQSFLNILSQHENQGLIGHLLYWPDRGYPILHDQCFYLDLSLFKKRDLAESGTWPLLDVSTEHVHDDYTPTWISHTCGTAPAQGGFGSGLIANVLSKKGKVVNWSTAARAYKIYLYPDQVDAYNKWTMSQAGFTERISNHLWVTNNETLYPVTGKQFVGPAAGACWWLNLCRPEIESAHLIDISYRQLDFARWMIDTWNGKDFGQFAMMYMFRNKVMSFTLDRDDVDAISLLRERKFAPYVNDWVDQQLQRFGIDDLESAWAQARRKPIKLSNEDLVQWVIKNHPVEGLWCSNVSMFKYTLLTNTWEDIELFNRITSDG